MSRGYPGRLPGVSDQPSSNSGSSLWRRRPRLVLAVGTAAAIVVFAGVVLSVNALSGSPASPTAFTGNPFSQKGFEAAGDHVIDAWNGSDGVELKPRPGAWLAIGFELRNRTDDPITITAVRGSGGAVSLAGVHLRRYEPAAGDSHVSAIRRPYSSTATTASYTLEPGAWVGVQLDFRLPDVCQGHQAGDRLVSDRTVTVAYVLAGHSDTRTLRSVPLRMTVPERC